MAVKKVARFDNGEMRLDAQKSPEGYLKATAKVSRTGVFPYLNQDGSVRYELRHPDDVFKSASLDSLKQVPVTLEHPRQMLSAANAKELSVGHVGDQVRVDSPFVMADLVITDAEAIRAVEAGKVELSCGYYLDLVEEAGVYEGQAYTHRQTNIRENHIAITDRARLGSDLRIDSDVPFAVRTEARADSNPNLEKKMVKIKINGLEYEAAPEVANELARLNSALETSGKEKETMKANLDAVTAERDSFKAKAEKLVADEPGKIAAAAKARAALHATASKCLDAEKVKALDSMTDLEIKKAVILARHKDAKLDGQSEEYIRVRFELATENLDSESAEEALARTRSASAPRHDSSDNSDPAKARQNMIKRHTDAWKPKEKAE